MLGNRHTVALSQKIDVRRRSNRTRAEGYVNRIDFMMAATILSIRPVPTVVVKSGWRIALAKWAFRPKAPGMDWEFLWMARQGGSTRSTLRARQQFAG
jgi:hypothetical protein